MVALVALVIILIHKKMQPQNKKYSLVIRNFTFGVEDSLVSTVGLLTGIALAGVGQKDLVLTGVVLIFVEAVSMAIGSLLSEHSVEEYEQQADQSMAQPIFGAIVMFLSYVIAGLIPLAPYFVSENRTMVWISVGLTLVSLFILGAVNGRMFKAKSFRDGLITLFMGGLAIVVGIVVGQLVEHF